MSELCEYELQRLEHMKRNHDMLVRLGLVDDAPKAESAAVKPKRVKLPPALPESLRRSGRVRGTVPEHSAELIHEHGDELDRQCERGGAAKSAAAKRKRAEHSADSADSEEAKAEMLESTMAFLLAAREALAQFVTSADGQAPSSVDGWRDEAVRRWGEQAAGGAGAGERDWEAW